MREKIFYVINLDKNRIGLLSLLLLGLLFSFFFLGVSVGRGNTKIAKSQMANENQISEASGEAKDEKDATDPNSVSESNDAVANHALNDSNLGNDSLRTDSALPSNPSQENAESAEEIKLSNKAPNSLLTTATNSTIVDLQSSKLEQTVPSENTRRQEILHSQDSKSLSSLSKKTPKKSNTLISGQTGIYTVQVAAFTDKSVAETYAKKINLENPRLKVKAYVKKRGKNFLVRLGADNDKDQLKKLISILKLDSSIRKSAIIVKNS
ncbi:MAG: SPOR domain-containing protein [Leptospiraceae bacterium]|jgi:cell division septation protein DedD|nr:SPOR domain-containing protein [Leptospiraceae bacterium]MCZ8346818.1 SPOR domain-containing protein [Leptospiraceae bacterium]